MTLNFTHIALHVQDIDAVVRFYRDYCGLELVHSRADGEMKVVWLAEPGRDEDFVFVVMSGGPGQERQDNDFSHLGFALENHEAVDAIAAKAEVAGCLIWSPRQEPPPIGYYCGVVDPTEMLPNSVLVSRWA